MLAMMAQSGHAQESWSLDACISYALDHNLMVEDFQLSEASREETYKQSYREFLPYVGGGMGYNIRYGRSVDPNTNVITNTNFFSNNYSINASLDLFRGFQRSNAIEASRFLLKAAKEDIRREEYLLAFRVMTAYYDVLFYHEQLKISQEQVAISQSQYDLVERQIELGLKAGTDLHEAKAVLISDQLVVTQSQNNLKASQLALHHEMNLENTDDFTIDPMEIHFRPEYMVRQQDPDSVFQSALAFLPDIRARQLRLAAAEKELSISRGNLLPGLSISGGYGTGFYETRLNSAGEIIPFGDQFRDNASYYYGLTLNIPIVDRWRIKSRINQQKIALRQSVNQLSIQKQEIEKLIRKLVQDYKAAQAEFLQSQQSEASGQLAAKVAQKKYEKGLISIIEYNLTKSMYALAQNENLQIRLKCVVLEKTLSFYRGLPVFDIN
ncbi:MAG TPA: TolC family protein [Membranihabitans sp.]|nr:TolC family protein [Membranihabitans sp.]